MRRRLPAYGDLTWDQHMGRHCIWCNQLIEDGGREVGRVTEERGERVLSVPVYAGPCCLKGGGK